MRTIAFEELASCDLVIDAIYRGGTAKNLGADALARILPVGNQGGFRVAVGGKPKRPLLAVLFTSLADVDWPDQLDPETGRFTYYGDNKTPGHEIHETPRGGNELLRDAFAAVHGQPPRRLDVPPTFVFSRAGGRDVQFRGLVVPGMKGISATDDLVAVWRTSGGQRFQNYRALFTVLDASVISRAWLNEILAGNPLTDSAPTAWGDWVRTGSAKALVAPRTVVHRTKAEQLPSSVDGMAIIEALHRHFAEDPHGFESCAAELARMMDPNIVECDVTRPSRDGGRDAIGKYRIGAFVDPVTVEFALEAKCYAIGNAVGVKEMSRLISRLRHRQFGIFVTTSYVHEQAYKEIRDDEHPVVIMAAADIVRLLAAKGFATVEAVELWLKARFPTAES